jgi:hypothetical protein
MMKSVTLFLDSGAYSAFSKGIEIDLQDYIDYIHKYRNYIEVYANLDDIKDPEKTWENQKEMERQGLSPLPVYHAGESDKYLKKVLEYDYFAIGGAALLARNERLACYDRIFSMICPKKNDYRPTHKIHGFGMTSIKLMFQYPWYSVDSTSWVLTSRMGSVFVPRFKRGRYEYKENPWKVVVSNRSPLKTEPQSDSSWHIDKFSPLKKEIIMNYFEEKGFKLGLSEYRQEDDDYVLKENEKWYGKEEADGVRDAGLVPKGGWSQDKIVEVIVEEGVST